MIHTLPNVRRKLDDKKGTSEKPVDVANHLKEVSNYLNHLHALMCGPDDSPERLKILNALQILNC